jgi:hypothetical protein
MEQHQPIMDSQRIMHALSTSHGAISRLRLWLRTLALSPLLLALPLCDLLCGTRGGSAASIVDLRTPGRQISHKVSGISTKLH